MRTRRPHCPIIDESRKKKIVLKTKLATGTSLSCIKSVTEQTTFHSPNSNCFGHTNRLLKYINVLFCVLFSVTAVRSVDGAALLRRKPPSLSLSLVHPPRHGTLQTRLEITVETCHTPKELQRRLENFVSF